MFKNSSIHIRILAFLLLLAASLLFLFRPDSVFAADQWWGCTFNPVTLTGNATYFLTYANTNQIVNFTPQGGTTPLSFWKTEDSTSWNGPFLNISAMIKLLNNGTQVAGFNDTLPPHIGTDVTIQANTETAFQWTPPQTITVDTLQFFSSDPGPGQVEIWDQSPDFPNGPKNLKTSCTFNNTTPPPTHKACVSNSCALVTGAGSDTCQVDNNCLPAFSANLIFLPQIFSLKDKDDRWAYAHVVLPSPYNSQNVNCSSILINNSVPAVRCFDIFPKDRRLTAQADYQKLAKILPLGRNVTVTLTGNMNDGTPFQAKDTILVIR